MRLAPSRAISSSVSVISPACTEEVSVDSLSMGGVSFPPPASGVFVCWAHAEGYAALFHPIKSRDPQLLRIPPRPQTEVMVAFIDAYRQQYGVEPISSVLPIAPSTDYAHKAAA